MQVHRLANGQQVVIRPIRPDDSWRLQDGLKHLSLQTVRRRFLTLKRRFTSAELRYFTEVDGVNHIALVAISPTTGHLLAVARAVRIADTPDLAEWAIVVADSLQRRGLGTVLMQTLVDECAKVGIHRFSALIDGENEAVRKLLAHAPGTRRETVGRGTREVLVDLAA